MPAIVGHIGGLSWLEPQKLKVTQTSTKAQAAGAGSLGVSSLVVAIVQLLQIQMTPEQLAALVTIAGRSPRSAVPGSPPTRRSSRTPSRRTRRSRWSSAADERARYEAFRRWEAARSTETASVPTAVVDAARKVG